MKRWLTTIGSLLLLGACRMFVPSDKRPPFRGAVREPVWAVEGIAAESVDASAGVVLVIGRVRGEPSKQLFALDVATGRRLWSSPLALQRVVALGQRTAFVLDAGERLHWIDLASGGELNSSRNWRPFTFSNGLFYGFDDEHYLVSVDEDGRTLQRAFTAFEMPAQLASSGEVVAALGRIPGGGQQRLVVFDRRTLRSLWGILFALPKDWVGRTDLLVGDGAVFVTEYEIHAEGDFCTTHALDARTGKQQWQRVDRGETRQEDGLLGIDSGVLLLKKPYKGYTIASATSGMERQNIGFEPAPFFVSGIDPHTGKDVWIASLYTRGGDGIVAAGGLLFTRDKKYYALIDEAGQATPASWLTCVNPATSAELWRSKVLPETYLTKPAVAGDLVYVGGSPYGPNRGTAVVFAFRATETKPGGMHPSR